MDLLRKAWRIWKRVGQFIGDMVARVVLTVFYFSVFVPFGLGVRLLGDPLSIDPGQQPKWFEPAARDLGLENARRLS